MTKKREKPIYKGHTAFQSLDSINKGIPLKEDDPELLILKKI